MQRLVFFWACLGCMCHGRRLNNWQRRTLSDEFAESHEPLKVVYADPRFKLYLPNTQRSFKRGSLPVKRLTSLLAACKPAATFSPSYPGGRFCISKSMHAVSHAVVPLRLQGVSNRASLTRLKDAEGCTPSSNRGAKTCLVLLMLTGTTFQLLPPLWSPSSLFTAFGSWLSLMSHSVAAAAHGAYEILEPFAPTTFSWLRWSCLSVVAAANYVQEILEPVVLPFISWQLDMARSSVAAPAAYAHAAFETPFRTLGSWHDLIECRVVTAFEPLISMLQGSFSWLSLGWSSIVSANRAQRILDLQIPSSPVSSMLSSMELAWCNMPTAASRAYEMVFKLVFLTLKPVLWTLVSWQIGLLQRSVTLFSKDGWMDVWRVLPSWPDVVTSNVAATGNFMRGAVNNYLPALLPGLQLAWDNLVLTQNHLHQALISWRELAWGYLVAANRAQEALDVPRPNSLLASTASLLESTWHNGFALTWHKLSVTVGHAWQSAVEARAISWLELTRRSVYDTFQPLVLVLTSCLASIWHTLSVQALAHPLQVTFGLASLCGVLLRHRVLELRQASDSDLRSAAAILLQLDSVGDEPEKESDGYLPSEFNIKNHTSLILWIQRIQEESKSTTDTVAELLKTVVSKAAEKGAGADSVKNASRKFTGVLLDMCCAALERASRGDSEYAADRMRSAKKKAESAALDFIVFADNFMQAGDEVITKDSTRHKLTAAVENDFKKVIDMIDRAPSRMQAELQRQRLAPLREELKILDLSNQRLETITLDDVTYKHRKLAKIYHPDARGRDKFVNKFGNKDPMVEINGACDKVKKALVSSQILESRSRSRRR